MFLLLFFFKKQKTKIVIKHVSLFNSQKTINIKQKRYQTDHKMMFKAKKLSNKRKKRMKVSINKPNC